MGRAVVVIGLSGCVLMISASIVRKRRGGSEFTIYNQAGQAGSRRKQLHAKTDLDNCSCPAICRFGPGAEQAAMGAASDWRDGGVRSGNVRGEANDKGSTGRGSVATEGLTKQVGSDAVVWVRLC